MFGRFKYIHAGSRGSRGYDAVAQDGIHSLNRVKWIRACLAHAHLPLTPSLVARYSHLIAGSMGSDVFVHLVSDNIHKRVPSQPHNKDAALNLSTYTETGLLSPKLTSGLRNFSGGVSVFAHWLVGQVGEGRCSYAFQSSRANQSNKVRMWTFLWPILSHMLLIAL